MRRLVTVAVLVLCAGASLTYRPERVLDIEGDPETLAWYDGLKPSDAEAKLFEKALLVTTSRIVNPRRISSDILDDVFPRVVFVEFIRVPATEDFPARNWIAVDPETGLTCIGARFGNVEKLFQMREVRLVSLANADRVSQALDAFLNPIKDGMFSWSNGEHELRDDGKWILNMNTPRPHIVVDVDADGFISNVTYKTRVIPFER